MATGDRREARERMMFCHFLPSAIEAIVASVVVQSSSSAGAELALPPVLMESRTVGTGKVDALCPSLFVLYFYFVVSWSMSY